MTDLIVVVPAGATVWPASGSPLALLAEGLDNPDDPTVVPGEDKGDHADARALPITPAAIATVRTSVTRSLLRFLFMRCAGLHPW
jgi:hypothetical protein